MKNFPVYVPLFLLITLTLVLATPAFSQTAPASIVFTAVNANETFPEVQVQVKVLDAENNFISGLNANQFSLKEDGQAINIENVSSESLPLNLRVVFVVDELAIGSNVNVVRQAIQSFAENQMQPGDSVIVLAASNLNVFKIIVPLTSDPQQVLDGIANYNPVPATATDFLQTVDQGLDTISDLNENIVGLNKLVVFSISINDQLDLNRTIAKANRLGVQVHTVLLGSNDINGALDRLARETGVEDGLILGANIRDLSSALNPERNETQYQIRYRSQINRAGDNQLTLTVNNSISENVTFTLDELEPPLLTITAPSADTEIIRTETIFSQDSDAIQPTEQTVAVEVTFPDGHPRQIIEEQTALVINGKAVGPATAIRDNGSEVITLEFTWDLRPEQTPGITPISIVVETEDELGLKSKSEVLPVTVEYVVYDIACPEFVSTYAPALCTNYNLILPLISVFIAIIALVIVIVYLRRNPKVQERIKEGARRLTMTMMPSKVNNSATMFVDPNKVDKAVLVVLEGYAVSKQTQFPINETITIGRSSEHAKLVLQGDKEGSPISRLHCTILEKNGAFEIRDESSANGTHLNETRLPAGKVHPLNDNDIIELARVRDGGVKFKIQIAKAKSAERLKTRMMTSVSDEPEEKPSGGYIPTKKLD
ncbi:MAG TPA: hypothetical protein DHW49_13475 [Anaerolineae bacterium]|nr:hypothetical protein [Anaerolineae bacterium]